MKKYLVVYEQTNKNYSAYSPDIPGCVATGTDYSEVKSNMKEAIQFHIEGLKEDGLPVPEPVSTTDYIEV